MTRVLPSIGDLLCCSDIFVVEASCVSYLVAMLYEHIDPASEQMVQFAGTALLQLAAGAMTRAGSLTGGSLAILEPGGADKQDAVVK